MNYKFQEYVKKREEEFLGRKVLNSDLIRISDANQYYNGFKKRKNLLSRILSKIKSKININ